MQQQPAGLLPATAPTRTTPRLRSGREEKDVKSELASLSQTTRLAATVAATQPPAESAPTVIAPSVVVPSTSLPVASCVSRDYTLTVRSLRATAGRRAALCEERRRIEAGKKILKVT